MEYYLDILKRKESLTHAETQMNLEDMLSQTSYKRTNVV